MLHPPRRSVKDPDMDPRRFVYIAQDLRRTSHGSMDWSFLPTILHRLHRFDVPVHVYGGECSHNTSNDKAFLRVWNENTPEFDGVTWAFQGDGPMSPTSLAEEKAAMQFGCGDKAMDRGNDVYYAGISGGQNTVIKPRCEVKQTSPQSHNPRPKDDDEHTVLGHPCYDSIPGSRYVTMPQPCKGNSKQTITYLAQMGKLVKSLAPNFATPKGKDERMQTYAQANRDFCRCLGDYYEIDSKLKEHLVAPGMTSARLDLDNSHIHFHTDDQNCPVLSTVGVAGSTLGSERMSKILYHRKSELDFVDRRQRIDDTISYLLPWYKEQQQQPMMPNDDSQRETAQQKGTPCNGIIRPSLPSASNIEMLAIPRMIDKGVFYDLMAWMVARIIDKRWSDGSRTTFAQAVSLVCCIAFCASPPKFIHTMEEIYLMPKLPQGNLLWHFLVRQNQGFNGGEDVGL